MDQLTTIRKNAIEPSWQSTPLITLNQVSKIYETPSGLFTALSEINLEVN